MNDHEAERIAASINQLRPDWPAASVLTLIRNKLINRPRRDVAVALAWVACETESKTPARVVEVGPWWKAAGVEASESDNRLHDRGPWCKNCGTGPESATHRSGECEYTLWPAQVVRLNREATAGVRDVIARKKRPTPLAVVKDEPTTCETGDCIRGVGHTGPHQEPPMREPEPEEAS